MPEPKELVSARLLIGGPAGLRSELNLAKGVDHRTLLMLAHDLLVAVEQRGFLTPAIAQARPLIKDQLSAWGLAHSPFVPAAPTTDESSGRNIAV